MLALENSDVCENTDNLFLVCWTALDDPHLHVH